MALNGDLIFSPITDIELSDRLGIDEIETEIAEKSKVTYTPTVTSGTELGKIKIDNTTKKIYAPTIPPEKHLEWVTVATGTAGDTNATQLASLNTTFEELSIIEKNNTRLYRGGSILTVRTITGTFTAVATSGSQFNVYTAAIASANYYNYKVDASTNTFTDLTETASSTVWELQVLRLVDNE